MKNLQNFEVTEMNQYEISSTNGGGDLVDAVNWLFGFIAGTSYKMTQAHYAGGGR